MTSMIEKPVIALPHAFFVTEALWLDFVARLMRRVPGIDIKRIQLSAGSSDFEVYATEPTLQRVVHAGTFTMRAADEHVTIFAARGFAPTFDVQMMLMIQGFLTFVDLRQSGLDDLIASTAAWPRASNLEEVFTNIMLEGSIRTQGEESPFFTPIPNRGRGRPLSSLNQWAREMIQEGAPREEVFQEFRRQYMIANDKTELSPKEERRVRDRFLSALKYTPKGSRKKDQENR